MREDPIKVCVVDDDEEDFIIIKEIFSKISHAQYVLDWTKNFDSALEKIAKGGHDVYLFDYRIGEKNGLDLLRESIKSGCKAPIILLTGQGNHETDLEAMKAGASDYMQKNEINPMMLERSIRYSIEHKRLEEELFREKELLKELLKEKETLLKEVHHRVKNNLGVISSILHLETMRTSNQEVINILHNCSTRINSMALIHTQLYQSRNINEVDMETSVRELVSHLSQLYYSGMNIGCEIMVQDIKLRIEKAIPCGLVINEIVSNSYKYAFKDADSGLIRVLMGNDGPDRIKLTVSDNGPGLPPGVDAGSSNTLGLKLIRLLVKQIDGELAVDDKKGLTYSIVFKP